MLKAPEDATQPQAIASSLEACILALDTPAADTTLGTIRCCLRLETIIDIVPAQGTGSAVWKSTLELVKSLSDVLTSSIPHFWKIAKEYMEGKFRKVRVIDLSAFHSY